MFGQTGQVLVLMMILLASLGAAVFGAEYWKSTQTPEERTSRPAEAVAADPEEQGEAIVRDYFTAMMNDETQEGLALTSLEIGKADASDPDRIRVSVTAHYSDGTEWPPIDYFVIRKGDRYKVLKRLCILDADPNSPGRGTARCTSDYTEQSDGTISVPGSGNP
ncbi:MULTISPECIES: hypothetical protein [Paenibacillus]|uniref:hypothetical protein n=1 Tax=Paenibacillus TaxID=44249 RepID=UPI0022B87FDE|nr:hypothetical protein [Paenibacillus caseinilyticus]MCZ8523917.1 hypothetical protein [Paenibacillus caseinilyticus]